MPFVVTAFLFLGLFPDVHNTHCASRSQRIVAHLAHRAFSANPFHFANGSPKWACATFGDDGAVCWVSDWGRSTVRGLCLRRWELDGPRWSHEARGGGYLPRAPISGVCPLGAGGPGNRRAAARPIHHWSGSLATPSGSSRAIARKSAARLPPCAVTHGAIGSSPAPS